MKLLRLARFNIRKHKGDSISLFLLLMMCMALIATSVSGLSATARIFDEAFDRTECAPGFVFMDLDEYKEIYPEYFRDDTRLKRWFEMDAAMSYDTKFINESGQKRAFYSFFVTEEEDGKMEKLILDSPLTRDEIYSKEHFVILPFYVKNTLKYKVGDTFEVFYKDKVFPFEIAGFYESGYYAGNSEMKLIVSPSDLALMQKLIGHCKIIGYEMNDPAEEEQFLSDFYDFAEENAVGTEVMELSYKHINRAGEKEFRLNTLDIFTKIMQGMALMIFISVAFIIMFRIKNDIDEQLTSIGVLEALGYRSGEIALTYVMEYLMITVPAVICGLLLSMLTTPVLVHIGERLMGHQSFGSSFGDPPIVFGLVIIAVVAVISLWRAVRIRKLPPVVAFRKGTGDHTHKVSLLSVEKTKFSVHLRLAAKSFLSELGSNIGTGFCIALSVVALMVCFVFYDIAGKGIDAFMMTIGRDVSDISIVTMPEADVQAMAEEIAAMPEVKETMLMNSSSIVTVEGMKLDSTQYVLAYNEAELQERVRYCEGRAPKHDNECAVPKNELNDLGVGLGDTVTLVRGKLRYDYIISGIVDTTLSFQANIYMTPDGYRYLDPSYSPDQIEIFLNDRSDREAVTAKLKEMYGAPADRENYVNDGDSLEERIRAEAELRMSAMLEMYGIDHMDYAIQIGDTIIKGDSSRFRIKTFVYLTDLLETALDPLIYAIRMGTTIFMVISLVLIVLIISLLIGSAVRKQRHEFGIMKGMGYTSGELMIQTAVKVVPTLLISVILGCIAGISGAGIIYSKYGDLPIMTVKVVIIAVCVVVFGFAVAYRSARKIKNISVYELMQE